MKRSGYLIIVLVIIVLLPLLGHFLWMVQKQKPMNLMIVNKTVPSSSENEVKSLNWVLNYEKVSKQDNEGYDFSKDYFGYHPDALNRERLIRSYRLEELPGLGDEYDGLIYLDNEGVEYKTPGYSSISHYGGFNQTDYLLLKEMINNEKLVITEFNFFSEPTEELVRYNTEQLMDVYTLRWKGKFFKDLDKKKIADEIDIKWIDSYKEINKKDWDYKGSGLILCNEKQDRIIVLPTEEYMTEAFPAIETSPENTDKYNLPAKTAFEGWFEVVYEGGNEVISNINLNLNEEGVEYLKKNGLNSTFPACVKMADKPVYFLAADFSKQDVVLAWSKMRILSDLCRGICRGRTKNPGQFFQTYYIPFMSTILQEYHKSNNLKEST
ncbi:MAG: hypothetical protein ACP5E3_12990 [Bacteroidales bacterium]